MKYDNGDGYTLEKMYMHFVGQNTFPKIYLPFANDYGSNLFCINIENGKIVIIWLDKGEVEENKISILFNSFPDFICSLEEEEE